MPRLVDHVLKSFSKVLELAETVDSLGGVAKTETAAEKMKLKVTGSFQRLIQAAMKHGVIEKNRGELSTTAAFTEIKHAYTPQDKLRAMQIVFLNVPIYEKIYQRFKGKDVPYDFIDKALIKEFAVERDYATPIAGYFIEGAKQCELIVDDKVIDLDKVGVYTLSIPAVQENHSEPGVTEPPIKHLPAHDTILIHINGMGMDTTLDLSEEDDLIILDAYLKKAKNKLKKKSESV